MLKPEYISILRMRVVIPGFFLLFLSTPCPAKDSLSLPFSQGETITYNIQKLKLNVGEATLVFGGLVDLGGRQFLHITFTAKGFRFFDKEDIYLDPETFYPHRIERDLDIFGTKERIIEFYDDVQGEVRIVKTAKGRTTEQIIEGANRFENIYGFIYRYRQRGQFKDGEAFDLHLPTRNVTFKLIDKGLFKAAGQEFEAYSMSSVPDKKYKVQFDSSSRKIPLMIDGAIGFGHTSMIMKNYDSNSGK
jgi:hypothetical protein